MTTPAIVARVFGHSQTISAQEVARSQLEIATAGKRTSDERARELLATVAWHRRVTPTLAITLIAALLVIFAQLRSAKRIPMSIVEVDSRTHRVLAAGLVQPASGPDAKTTQAVVEDWIENWRTVLTDIDAQRQLAEKVFAHLEQTDPTNGLMTHWYQANDPRERAKKESVTVTINNVLDESAHTFMVYWTETPHAQGNTSQDSKPTRWRARVTVKVLGTPTDPQQLRMNPFGIFIADLGEPQQENQ